MDIDWRCEEEVGPPPVEGARPRYCGRAAFHEYIPKPYPSGRVWVAVCDEHAEQRERDGYTVREFTGMARW